MTKVNRRIKSTQPKKPRFIWLRRLLSTVRLLLIVSIFVSVFGIIGFYSITTSQKFLNRPIAHIVVEGEFSYTSKASIIKAAQGMIGSSFVGENMSAMKQRLEATPWVDTVHLYRQWPDTLSLLVTEQVPIARWGDQGFVNVRGELINTDTSGELDHLGLLYSEQQDAAVMMQQYLTFARLLEPYELTINTLTKSRRGSWEMRLDNNWLVKLGQGDIGRKLQQLRLLMERDLLNASMDIIMIDSRYSNGVAVEWGSEEKLDQSVSDTSNIKHKKSYKKST